MTTKAEFDAAEWETVVEGPVIAGLIVVTAQRGGSIREAMAIGKEYVDEATKHKGELLGEIAEKPPRLSPKEFSSSEALRTEGLQRIAAAADKSGGTLGIGGVEVSDAESAALDEIAATVGVQRS
jgi:hypothetical protein